MDEIISADCDALLCVLYREYLTRCQHGVPRERASYFRDDVSVRNSFLPGWPLEDVTAVCWELRRKGFLSVHPGDDRANDISLTFDGLAYMEGRFGRRVDAVISRLRDLADLVLFPLRIL